MSKALVTGGAGFIGSNVVKLLVEEGYDTVVLDNLSSGYQQNLEALAKARFVGGDIRNGDLVSKLMDGVNVVFHLAAAVGNLRSIEQPIEDSDVNVIGTVRVLEAARKAGVKKVVFSSSAAIFGEVKHLPIREDHPLDPESPYGASKMAAEKLCLAYSRLYEFEVACLRYFNVYGVNQRYDAYGNVIPIFAHRLLHGQPLVIFGDGQQTRDFVNVRDVARANILAATTNGASGAFNIASGTSTTINSLVDILREIHGDRLAVEHAPPRKGEVRDSCADISAARKNLGFEPAVDIKQGLSEYVDWVKLEMRSL
ncbi:MAG: SDR family oxidoreductase [Deltaproteobacteria bacterium]|nr:SDR family oxidoreductase [Deltaproteobacteria bacterium]